MKYSDYFMEELRRNGYSTCFFVGGGNSMHLLESASRYFTCIPVVHEVSAAISSEYFNQASSGSEKAFALVTAGPGLTNLITGIAGAWLDSRELLVIGGQAKSTNLAKGKVRQVGHQEIDGVGIVKGITKSAVTFENPMSAFQIREIISESWKGRPGPVFIEICLDVTAMEVDSFQTHGDLKLESSSAEDLVENDWKSGILELLRKSERPLLLLGGGVSKRDAKEFERLSLKWKFPIACTWTGADRCGFDYPYFAGRPNTYGMRWSNIVLQQSDLLIAVGTSLGFQQTGFNIEEFLPIGKLVHVDIDMGELEKLNPKNRLIINSESGNFLKELATMLQDEVKSYSDWTEFISSVRESVPILEDSQITNPPTVSPHTVINMISDLAGDNDAVVAASSGGTFTAVMQVFRNKGNQILIGNKGLASMGYGLAGAIGIAVQKKNQGAKCILFEGDGGFAQNMQEIGTAVANDLNLKIFITCNDGYASIRSSQASYFGGHYLGCDTRTGLVLPDWKKFMDSYGIPVLELTSSNLESPEFSILWNSSDIAVFLIQSDADQRYLPKIMSRVGLDGTMSSTALHDMSPVLDSNIANEVFRYIDAPHPQEVG